MGTKKEEFMTYVPIEEATKPRNGVWNVLVNAWWSVVEKNGVDCVMFYRKTAPQCNLNKSILDALNKELYPESKAIQLPVVYVPWSIKEY